ncbi:uncharacterized protein ACBR49_000712 [Aulostomus maculatus]
MGSSLQLHCPFYRPGSHLRDTSMKWYKVDQSSSDFPMHELLDDGSHITLNISEENDLTLTLTHLSERDAGSYICCNEGEPHLCGQKTAELYVADVQVKVIPATTGKAVTLKCTTSCSLTEDPVTYIWYRNGEFYYQDWSPWYQHLVSSDKDVRYSCAVRGSSELRAPEVSVDSISGTCFSVTYAKGRLCSEKQTSVDGSCSITCPGLESQTAYRFYLNGWLNKNCRSSGITLFNSTSEVVSCAIEDNEELCSAQACANANSCAMVNYVSRRICVVEGSSVNISSEYSKPRSKGSFVEIWYKTNRGSSDEGNLIQKTDRVRYRNMINHHILEIDDVSRNDSGEYVFTLQDYVYEVNTLHDTRGVTLVVTGLSLVFHPTEVMTEGQSVTLVCSTSCPLNDATTYIWYFNSLVLDFQQKLLVLSPLGLQHAGNYSCAVQGVRTITSPEETLTVRALGKAVAILNGIKLIVLLLILPAAVLFHRWIRKREALLTADLKDKELTRQMDHN